MSTTIKDVESVALQLAPELRARLAVKLIESLERSQGLSSEQIERLWLEEAEERLRQLESGEVEPIPAQRVFENARDALK